MEFRMLIATFIFVFLLNHVRQCLTTQENLSDNIDNSTVVITTSLGRIRGKILTSRLGESFYAFRGIRYARSPVNELRFQAPQPVEPWTHEFDATKDGPMCPQSHEEDEAISEDCLRLNVYTKSLPSKSSLKSSKPVIIYIHPGGFYGVSGQSFNFAGPQVMMDRDVVFVTINYRLATLGLLATGTKDAPGNAALKDQVMAMKFVKEHISKFDGDPNSVTLIGYSVGALSITLHMVSPMTKGLFHKAVVMSAAATSQLEFHTDQLYLAERQAGLLGCPQNNFTEMIDCMKKADYRKYANTTDSMFEFARGNPILLWNAVIEPDYGQERFLIENPTESYLKGNFMKIPIIAGITKDEFVFPAVYILRDENLRSEMDNNFEKNAPICFLYERNTVRSHNISKELRAAYLGSEPLSLNKSFEGLRHLFADGVIGFGVHRFVNLVSRYTPIRYYRFSYLGRYGHTYYPADKPFGPVHHDDLLYFLYVPGLIPLFTKDDPENKIVERSTRMWENFAKYGDPIPSSTTDTYLRGVQWEPFSLEQQNYLDIGDELILKQNLYTERYAIWERLFPLNY